MLYSVMCLDYADMVELADAGDFVPLFAELSTKIGNFLCECWLIR